MQEHVQLICQVQRRISDWSPCLKPAVPTGICLLCTQYENVLCITQQSQRQQCCLLHLTTWQHIHACPRICAEGLKLNSHAGQWQKCWEAMHCSAMTMSSAMSQRGPGTCTKRLLPSWRRQLFPRSMCSDKVHIYVWVGLDSIH